MLEPRPVDLHEVVGCGHFHAVDPAQRLVKRSGAQILVTDTAGVPRRQPRRQQRERLRVDAGKSPQAPGIVTAQGERGIDDMRRPDDITAQHLDVDIEALAAHRLVEAAEDLDLLDQLAVADEAAPAPNALDVALSREVSHGLPDRGQADAQRLGEFSFPGQLPPWLQPTLLHALDHGDLDLVVQRHRAVPANRLQSHNQMSIDVTLAIHNSGAGVHGRGRRRPLPGCSLADDGAARPAANQAWAGRAGSRPATMRTSAYSRRTIPSSWTLP